MERPTELLDPAGVTDVLEALFEHWTPDDAGFARLTAAMERLRACPPLAPGAESGPWQALQMAGPGGIDRMLTANDVVALVFPTMPPAWKIDAVNGDQISGGGAGDLAAVAGYPHLTVPMGAVRQLPVGLSFVGPAWSEARLLALGYAFEQAAKVTLTPSFLPSIEDSPDVAKRLKPAR